MIRLPWQITRKMFLSEDEVDRLLAHVAKNSGEAGPDAVTAQVDEVIIRCLLFSGLRNSEFCGLILADTVIGTGKSVFLVRGTPREDRTVFVPQEFPRAIVRSHWSFQNEAALTSAPDFTVVSCAF